MTAPEESPLARAMALVARGDHQAIAAHIARSRELREAKAEIERLRAELREAQRELQAAHTEPYNGGEGLGY